MHRRYDPFDRKPAQSLSIVLIDLVVYSDSRSEHRWSEVFEQGAPEHARFSPESPNGSTTRMVLAFSDPDTMFARMIKAGSTAISLVQEQHGWYNGRVCEPCGHYWEIGSNLRSSFLSSGLDSQTQIFNSVVNVAESDAFPVNALADFGMLNVF